MTNLYHSYFKFWRNFARRDDFTWVAITKTVPSDYYGFRYMKLAPVGERFDEVCNPFNENKFFKVYAKMLSDLDKSDVVAELKGFSSNGKDVVLLNWEDLSKKSEGRFAFAWMFDMPMEKADSYDLANVISMKEKLKNNLSNSIFTL